MKKRRHAAAPRGEDKNTETQISVGRDDRWVTGGGAPPGVTEG